MANDVMTRPKTISLCLGMAGVIILSVSRLPWVSPTGFVEFTGIVLLFICTVSSAVGNVLVAREKSDLDPVFLNSLQIFLGGFFCFLSLFSSKAYRPGFFLLSIMWSCFGFPFFRPCPFHCGLFFCSGLV